MEVRVQVRARRIARVVLKDVGRRRRRLRELREVDVEKELTRIDAHEERAARPHVDVRRHRGDALLARRVRPRELTGALAVRSDRDDASEGADVAPKLRGPLDWEDARRIVDRVDVAAREPYLREERRAGDAVPSRRKRLGRR